MTKYIFDWGVIRDNLGALMNGLRITLYIAIAGLSIALVLGLIIALMRLSTSRTASLIAGIFTQIMRGVPLLVVLYWIYYGVAAELNLNFSPFSAGAIALGLTGSAYMAEVYRGGLNAIDPGQREAALAMGLRRRQAFVSVIFPQAFRIIIPPTVNVFVGLLKGATIVSVIGVTDMLYVAQVVSLRTFTPFELYSVAGLVLVAITVAIAGFSWSLERHLGRGSNRV
jgi:His/Glu/Gln/Arg/opine family amino acid ABC transporter permease subunit